MSAIKALKELINYIKSVFKDQKVSANIGSLALDNCPPLTDPAYQWDEEPTSLSAAQLWFFAVENEHLCSSFHA